LNAGVVAMFIIRKSAVARILPEYFWMAMFTYGLLWTTIHYKSMTYELVASPYKFI
jgi:predicted membrane chloride channel (bestrophin family)